MQVARNDAVEVVHESEGEQGVSSATPQPERDALEDHIRSLDAAAMGQLIAYLQRIGELQADEFSLDLGGLRPEGRRVVAVFVRRELNRAGRRF